MKSMKPRAHKFTSYSATEYTQELQQHSNITYKFFSKCIITKMYTSRQKYAVLCLADIKIVPDEHNHEWKE